MSDLTGGAATGGENGPREGAFSGTADEADLPRLQGLDESVDDPSDPEAARGGDDAPGEVPFSNMMNTGDSKSGSDPMPDMSGTSGQ